MQINLKMKTKTLLGWSVLVLNILVLIPVCRAQEPTFVRPFMEEFRKGNTLFSVEFQTTGFKFEEHRISATNLDLRFGGFVKDELALSIITQVNSLTLERIGLTVIIIGGEFSSFVVITPKSSLQLQLRYLARAFRILDETNFPNQNILGLGGVLNFMINDGVALFIKYDLPQVNKQLVDFNISTGIQFFITPKK